MTASVGAEYKYFVFFRECISHKFGLVRRVTKLRESLWVQGQLQGHKTEVRFGVMEDRMRMSLSDTG